MVLLVESIHEIGKRENNEDSLLINNDKSLYMVCDGVGGSNKGEEASRITVDSFNNFLKDHSIINAISIKQALLETESKFDEHINSFPESNGMATTLTLIHFHNNRAIIAHCGDSRVYQIRNNKIVFKTKDHSLVQELVDGGYISEEAALTHPKRNHITKAIRGSKHPTSVELNCIENIDKGDYFVLCSDGILESISDEMIEDIFNGETQLSKIKEFIKKECDTNSKDNFTCILIEVQSLETPKKDVIIKDKVKTEKKRNWLRFFRFNFSNSNKQLLYIN